MGTSYNNGTGAASKRRNNIYRANDGPFYVRLIFAAPLNPKCQGWWNLLGFRSYSSCAIFTLLVASARTHTPPHTTRFEHLLFGTIVVAVVFVIVAGAVVTFHFIFFALFFFSFRAKFGARIRSRLGGDFHSHCQSTRAPQFFIAHNVYLFRRVFGVCDIVVCSSLRPLTWSLYKF